MLIFFVKNDIQKHKEQRKKDKSHIVRIHQSKVSKMFLMVPALNSFVTKKIISTHLLIKLQF